MAGPGEAPQGVLLFHQLVWLDLGKPHRGTPFSPTGMAGPGEAPQGYSFFTNWYGWTWGSPTEKAGITVGFKLTPTVPEGRCLTTRPSRRQGRKEEEIEEEKVKERDSEIGGKREMERRQTDRQTDRDRDRQTNRPNDRQTELKRSR